MTKLVQYDNLPGLATDSKRVSIKSHKCNMLQTTMMQIIMRRRWWVPQALHSSILPSLFPVRASSVEAVRPTAWTSTVLQCIYTVSQKTSHIWLAITLTHMNGFWHFWQKCYQ